MRKPNGGTGIDVRIARCIVAAYKLWAVRYIWVPLLMSVLPVLVLTYYGSANFENWVGTNYQSLGAYLKANVALFVILVGAYPAVLLALGRAIRERAESREVEVDVLLALIASLDSIVGCKHRGYSSILNKTYTTKETAFCELIDPQQQIAEIVRSICDFFNATRPDGKQRNLIRVSLAVIGGGKIIQIPICYPNDEGIRSTIESLNNPYSGIMIALKTKKILVIGSIQKELRKGLGKRRFCNTGVEEDNMGSMICYPVLLRNSKEVPFVISVHVDEEGYFNPHHSDLYIHSLERFALRLSLEYSLITLKEKLCEPAS